MKIEIPTFDSVKVLVVGDVMLDRYWLGPASRMSPEAPVPVLQVNELEERPGGAGNVAVNLSALGCQVSLLSIVGQDNEGKTLQHLLTEAGVACQFHAVPNFSTITKLRAIARNQQLIRLDFEKKLDPLHAKNLQADFASYLNDVDVIVLSDYAKGTLCYAQDFIRAARQAGVPVLVDPKHHDFTLYRGATLITPNLKEFEAVVGACATQEILVEKGHRLLKEQDLTALLVTQGEHGMTLLQAGQNPLYLPTRAREVYDVTGAGDTVISVFAAAMAANEPLPHAAALANIAAGIVIRKLGATSISVPELRRALQRVQGSAFGVLTEDELLTAVEDARAHGERVVMTNGCFDILHAGHVQYLEQAKELGQRLVVAVNTDASVRRLKGDSRPLNPLNERMSVLAALRAVDWVVPFSEDTPERLIKRVSPDILVKGADYVGKEIAGAADVVAKGGRIELLPFKPGCSTTKVVEKISAQKKVLV